MLDEDKMVVQVVVEVDGQLQDQLQVVLLPHLLQLE